MWASVRDRYIAFCKRLLHDAPGPVYLIVDGPALPSPGLLG
jgi:hypothetical protein